MTGALRSTVDRVWDAFWSGGISNPLEVLEQITYLLFVRRLDELQTVRDRTARRGVPDSAPFFGPDQQDLRWGNFKDDEPARMYRTVADKVFPHLRTLGGEDSTYAHHMKDARFTVPTPGLLSRVVLLLEGIPLQDKDTNGDLYEYMLGKIATAGQNGQFRTPRHIIRLMVEMTEPHLRDEICDPACGTAGFLVDASEYVRRVHRDDLLEADDRHHFHNGMFHGFDFDSTMLRIGAMNMLMHGVASPDIRYRDSLSQSAGEESDRYSLILANPPFAGSLDHETTSSDLLEVVRTKKSELLFLALFLKLLGPGGRAAVVVPDGVLFGSTKAHRELRRMLVEDQRLDAVVKLPSGVFKPYAGVSTAILFFTRTDSGGTDDVWFYDVRADGFSLDDRRAPLLPEDRLGARATHLTAEEHARNNLPDVLARWRRRTTDERERARTDQSFCVPRADIAAQAYDLSLNRYKEVVHEEVLTRSPLDILADLERLNKEIGAGTARLKEMLA
ncbi:type I restriction-modification system subunit M [Streptomyces gibsoniae]|uniref:site-specific DNA-methyltransferase (adenine-specific) n=1 Tax=Streptomyces gibsoniae TaxID=3075529 RepID=A0ABU2TRM8_9ACTN|nr:class I SAM-dependent DNA methyltransferase [Streptomyces sp. DSM 41699]MDT0463593.1 class I SAM-dependent DNA methyltransferase [Streptomyces sp. DSM 41699]